MHHSLRVALLLAKAMYDSTGVYNFELAYSISIASGRPVGGGKSSYARRRRAASIGRCHRCYRLWPPMHSTIRCDNKTCVPGISYNERVAQYIVDGVTEVIPSWNKALL
uniref:RNA silencing suppressor n=1 Tax=Narcissus common latent virus TaxID=160844 RepID=A8W8Z2_9VIRU|nr:nucleic acid binding protein [Narcissus common latent virus]